MRIEDGRFLTGSARYVADLPGEHLHAVFVRSSVARGRVTAVNIDAARAADGVAAVFTASALGLAALAPDMAPLNQSMLRSWLASDEVRFVGEPVAVVVASSHAAALDAAELVEMTFDPAPPVIDLGIAEHDDALVHPDAQTNECLRMTPGELVVDPAATVEISIALDQPKLSPAPLEGRAALAVPDGDRLTVYVSGQGPHPYRAAFARALAMPADKIRVISYDVGGSFGGKALPHAEEIVVARAAQLLGRAVRWIDGRTESLLTLGHSRGQRQHLVLRGRPDGEIRSLDYRVVQDSGAYPRIGAFMSNMARLMLPGPYKIPSVRVDALSVVTNTNPHVAYRGAGQPEYAVATEQAVDDFARAIGADPVEVRRRNLIDAFPHTSPTGAVYDSGQYALALDTMLIAADYPARRAEQAARRARGDAVEMGIGVATFVESCSTSNQSEWARVQVNADATVDLWLGTSPHGQGHETVFAGLVERELGVAPHAVRIRHSDSELFESGTVTGGSRSMQTGGMAVVDAAAAVRARAADVAAQLLEASAADIVYNRSALQFHVAGTPARAVALAECAAASGNGCIEAALRFDPAGNTISFGAYLAVVDVDTETGLVTLRRFVAVDDAGVVLNRALVEGQVHGGVAQGIGQALYEAIVYDDAGNLLTTSFADYLIPSAAELPEIEAHLVETPSPRNALGVKGIGESGPIGALPAVINAVIDALHVRGVTRVALPASPENVWRALHGRP